MKAIALITATLLLSGCYAGKVWEGCVDTLEAGGMTFCSEVPLPDYMAEGVEETVKIVELEAQKYYPNVANFRMDLQLNQAHVMIIAREETVLVQDCYVYSGDILRCRKGIGGFTDYTGTDTVVQWMSCGSLATLGHELIHTVEAFYINGPTADHSTPFLWDGPESAMSRVSTAMKQWCWGP
jgi:hypothetical protein